jgi:hypothetical protein
VLKLTAALIPTQQDQYAPSNTIEVRESATMVTSAEDGTSQKRQIKRFSQPIDSTRVDKESKHEIDLVVFKHIQNPQASICEPEH